MSWLISKALMNSLYSQEQVEAFSEESYSDGTQSAPLNGNPIPQAYCAPDKMTDFSRLSQSGMTYKPLMESRGEELLTLCRVAFLAKISVQQGREQELKENDQVCGNTWPESSEKFSQLTFLQKTPLCSALEDSVLSSKTLPRWGMMLNGECYPQPKLALITNENVCGSSQKWPTPDANCGQRGSQPNWTPTRKSGHPAQYTINQAVRDRQTWPTPRSCSAMAATITPESAWNEKRNPNLETIVGRVHFPTPTCHNSKEGAYPAEYKRKTPSLATHAGGKLNPMWVEWLMGWPLGWTDLKPLETDKSHCVQQLLGQN